MLRDTLRSSLPTHISETTINHERPSEVLVAETRSPEILEPAQRKSLPPWLARRAAPRSSDPNEEPLSKVTQLMGKFIGSSILKVAKARGIDIPPDPLRDIACLMQEEDPMVTMTDLFKEIITVQTTNKPITDRYSRFSEDLTRIWCRKMEYQQIGRAHV